LHDAVFFHLGPSRGSENIRGGLMRDVVMSREAFVYRHREAARFSRGIFSRPCRGKNARPKKFVIFFAR